MTRIRSAATAVLAAAGLAIGWPGAAQSRDADSSSSGRVGDPVTLTACVERGEKKNTFILTHVADVPVQQPTMGRVVYWLDSVKKLEQHAGHQVRISGKIEKVERSEIEVRSGDDRKGGWYVEIEGPGRDVRTTPEKAGVALPQHDRRNTDIQTTLVRLKVGEIVTVADSCPVSEPK